MSAANGGFGKKRLVLFALTALALAPGTWVRSPIPPRDETSPVHYAELAIDQPDLGALRIVRAWHLTSQNDLFGGYSAMLYLGAGRLLLGSDLDMAMTVSVRDDDLRMVPMRQFPAARGSRKAERDLESLTRDPATGTIWGGYEGSNSIKQLDAQLNLMETIVPAEMQDWRFNSGPEAMVRLADGRFIVIAEGASETDDEFHPALLFEPGRADSHSLSGAKPTRFAFRPPEGFRPVDMVQLADGSVLILVRKLVWGIPPTFDTAIIRAEPAAIEAGGIWSGKIVARLNDPQFAENFEGMAVVTDGPAKGTIFVVSDDNRGVIQRTLLLQLRWDEPLRPIAPAK